MSCTACATKIESALNALPGVQMQVSFSGGRASGTVDPRSTSIQSLPAVIASLGYKSRLLEGTGEDDRNSEDTRAHIAHLKISFIIAALLAAPLLLNMVPMMISGTHGLPLWLQAMLALAVQVIAGVHFYRGAWKSVSHGYANMDVLVALGTTFALVFSLVVWLMKLDAPVYFESSAAIIAFVLMGKWLEQRALSRTGESIRALSALAPSSTRVMRHDALETIPTENVVVGDSVTIYGGESVPVDGVVTAGTALVDESMLTGESDAIEKQPGALLFAGTVNTDGTLTYRATAVGQDTELARIKRLVMHAQNTKASVQKLADRVAGVFVPSILILAVMTGIGWAVWGPSLATAFINAITVIVIACPCALGLATPAAMTVGIGRGARAGILLRDADALERLERVNHIILDKTGTLTSGKPAVEAVVPAPTFSTEDVLRLAASFAATSRHPLSRAIADYAAHSSATKASPLSVKVLPGLGLEAFSRASIGLARKWWMGSATLAAKMGADVSSVAAQTSKHRGSTVFIGEDSKLTGAITFRDQMRPTTADAIAALKTRGLKLTLASGDAPAATAAVAETLGLSFYPQSATPETKSHLAWQAQQSGDVVALVGDGINDTPAFATADVAIAMGGGTAAAIENADVVLLNNDVQQLVDALSLAHATMRKVRQNLFFAYAYNAIAITAAVAGLLTPIVAGAAMAASSVTVVTNALLLGRWRASVRRGAVPPNRAILPSIAQHQTNGG
jgi:P-type Cu+ transporter